MAHLRNASVHRQTLETDVRLTIDLDASQPSKIDSGIGFFDHMLQQLCRYARCSIDLTASGDRHIDDHHLVEDIGITLGTAIRQALGERRGIARYGSARVVMDETLVEVDVDLTTRIYLIYQLQPGQAFVGEFDTSLVREFWLAFTNSCGLNLHINQIRGSNTHHIIEACFKAVGKALYAAWQYDHSIAADESPSTKGML